MTSKKSLLDLHSLKLLELFRSQGWWQKRHFPPTANFLFTSTPVTVNKSRRQTLSTVGIDRRDDMFYHDQQYVVLSRTTARATIRRLVRPERLINGVPHANCVLYISFIFASTGENISILSALLYRPPNIASTQIIYSHLPLASELRWTNIDEIGDVKFLCALSRSVLHDPELQFQVSNVLFLTFVKITNIFRYKFQIGSTTNRSTFSVSRLVTMASYNNI